MALLIKSLSDCACFVAINNTSNNNSNFIIIVDSNVISNISSNSNSNIDFNKDSNIISIINVIIASVKSTLVK